MQKYDKYQATWKGNMAKCSKYHAKCKVTMPKCSKYHAKWQVLVPNCCKHKANGTGKKNQTNPKPEGKKQKLSYTQCLAHQRINMVQSNLNQRDWNTLMRFKQNRTNRKHAQTRSQKQQVLWECGYPWGGLDVRKFTFSTKCWVSFLKFHVFWQNMLLYKMHIIHSFKKWYSFLRYLISSMPFVELHVWPNTACCRLLVAGWHCIL